MYNIYIEECNNDRKLVGTLNNDGSFGELALLYNMPRAATVEAITSGTLWAMVQFVAFYIFDGGNERLCSSLIYLPPVHSFLRRAGRRLEKLYRQLLLKRGNCTRHC